MFTTINAVSLLTLPHYSEDNGDLVVMEGNGNVPFSIARVFIVRAPSGEIRGQHAHKECTQFLACYSGSVEVICDDGKDQVTFLLNKPYVGVLIPPGIWAQQTYLTENSVLTVLCDRPYEATDYIREYDEYIKYKKNNNS